MLSVKYPFCFKRRHEKHIIIEIERRIFWAASWAEPRCPQVSHLASARIKKNVASAPVNMSQQKFWLSTLLRPIWIDAQLFLSQIVAITNSASAVHAETMHGQLHAAHSTVCVWSCRGHLDTSRQTEIRDQWYVGDTLEFSNPILWKDASRKIWRRPVQCHHEVAPRAQRILKIDLLTQPYSVPADKSLTWKRCPAPQPLCTTKHGMTGPNAYSLFF